MNKKYLPQNIEKIALYNPHAVLDALKNNKIITNWLKFIATEYKPQKKAKILLLYPCTSVKPYHLSRNYRSLSRTFESLNGERKQIHLITISEPFGMIPEEFHNEITWNYDCPGLFEWWCNRNGKSFSREELDKSIDILGNYVGRFFQRAAEEGYYQQMFAFVRSYSSSLKIRPDHTHRRIIDLVKKNTHVNIEIIPPKYIVKEIVRDSGTFAWDMYGVAHPRAQNYLYMKLRRILFL